MEVLSLLIVAIFVVLLSIWLTRKMNGKKRLPGPMGLPIVGYIPFMTSKPYVKLTQLAKTYGPIYSLPLGSKRILVLTDFKYIKEAFGNEDFGGRPPDGPFELGEESIRTEAFLGRPWREQRRFCLHTFRELGFGKTRLEEHIKEEIAELIDHMSQYVGKVVKMSDLLVPSMSNNIASLLFGRRMKHDNPRRQRLNVLINDVGDYAETLSWQLFFPWIRAFMKHFGIGNQGKLVNSIEETKVFCRKEITEHEETLDPNNIRDFMDKYLLEIRKRSNKPETTFKREVLTDLSRQFFGAGSETVRIAVDWMLLLCATLPDVQKSIHREIDDVLGSERFPTGQDRSKMPYTDAAICEMMRWKSLLPTNVMRYTLKDTELNGYFIPKNTDVLAVFWAVDHNESLWGKDVFDYRPERFLSADGQKVVKPEHFIPFSIGIRSCLGKPLGEIQVFLYVTAILQKFEIQMPNGKQADLDGVLGVALQPKRQDLCLRYR